MKKNLIAVFLSLFMMISFFSQGKQAIETSDSDQVKLSEQKFDTYIKSAWDLMYSYPDSAFYYGNKAYQYADSNKLHYLFTFAYNVMGVSKIVNSEYDSAIILFEKGIQIANESLKPNTNINDEQKQKIEIKKIGLFSNIGNCYNHSSRYEQAIEYYQKSAKLAEKLKEKWRESVVYSNIGVCYQDLSKFDLAIEYHQKSLKLAQEAQDSISIASCYLNLAATYMHIGDSIKSKQFTIKAVKYFEMLDEDYLLKVAYFNLSKDYLQEQNYDSAYYFMQKAYVLMEKYPDEESEIFYHYINGEYQKYKQNDQLAITHYTKAYLLSCTYHSDKYKLYSCFQLEELYEKIGKCDSALQYLKISNRLSDEIFNEESDKRIAEMEIKYQVEKREADILHLEKQSRNEQKIRWLLFSLLGMSMISIVIIVSSYILRRKKTKLLHETEKKLLATELEKNKVQKQKLNEDIEFKTKQLTTHALNMMQKNKLLHEVNKSIAEILKNPQTDLNDSFRKLKRQISKSIRADNDWEVFKMYFEQINAEFFEKLRETYPALTTNDLRLCALIKLNLNIKETAAVLNLSPNSIKSARYQLRKRLQLKSEDSLSEFISKFS